LVSYLNRTFMIKSTSSRFRGLNLYFPPWADKLASISAYKPPQRSLGTSRCRAAEQCLVSRLLHFRSLLYRAVQTAQKNPSACNHYSHSSSLRPLCGPQEIRQTTGGWGSKRG
jgi:hypothetical protein